MRRYAAGFLTIVLLAGGVAAAGPDLRVGRDGAAPAIVVPDAAWIAPDAWAKMKRGISVYAPEKTNMVYFGARLLQEYVGKITGVELEVVAETEWERRGATRAVVVGPTRLAVRRLGSRISPENLKRSGYVLTSAPGLLFVCGVDPWGTYSGCAALLEEQCGVGWYWPTELGEEVPRKGEIVFDRLDETFQPAVAFMASGMNEEGNTWAVRVGMRPLEWQIQHSLGPDIYHAGREARPEWFSLLDGARSIPKADNSVFCWQPCMGSPASLERAASAAVEHFRMNPGATSFSMGTNDGVWRGCECAYCRALDGPTDPVFDETPYHYNGRYSARYYAMLSRTADALQQEFPGKLVGGWAYAGGDIPPADARPNKNLVIFVIGTKLAWLSPGLRAWEELRLKRWSRAAGRLMSYDYMYQTGYIPLYTPHLHADVVRTMVRNNVTSCYAELYPTIARSGPRYWVHMKMCLDPSQDVDALLDRWMRGMFKEAAAPMAEFYATIERCWQEYPYHERNADSWGTYCLTEGAWMPILTPAAVATLDACLARAESLAVDPAVKARLAVVRKNYVPTRACAEYLWRQRPYTDPVPFDDASVLADLREHVAGTAPFDAVAYYERECRGDPLSWMIRNTPPPIDTRERRLGRAVAGLLDRPLADAAAGRLSPDAVRTAVAARVAEFAAKAGASAAGKAELDRWAGRLVFVPKLASAPRLDGDLSDACRRGLETHGGFVAGDGASAARFATSFTIGHDGRNFHVGISCEQDPASVVAAAKKRTDPAVNKDDRIVLTLCPWQYRHSGGSGSVEITVTAGGVTTENGAGYGTTYWQAGTRAAARRTTKGYDLEIVVPFRAALFSPRHGPRLEFNIRRVVAGAGSETSAWFPPAMGTTFAQVMDGDAARLLEIAGAKRTEPLSDAAIVEPVVEAGWDAYVMEEPAAVRFPGGAGGAASVRGGTVLLAGKRYCAVQPGHRYEVVAEFRGAGAVAPSLGWYRRTEGGYEDVFAAAQDGAPTTGAAKKGWRRARALVTVPAGVDAARLRLSCSGPVEVADAAVRPVFPLEVTADLEMEDDRLVTGRVIALRATVRNVSEKPVEGLTVRLAYPWGVDRRADPVAAAPALEPGGSTSALWWLTPVYAVGQADFVFVLEGKGIPKQTVKLRGPVPR